MKLATINDYILNHERELQKVNKRHIQIQQVGWIHEQDYCAYRFENPAEEFPTFESAIVSIAGCQINENKLEINVCWISLIETLRAIFNTITKEIIVLAAGRKLIESESFPFLDLLALQNVHSKATKRKLTIVVHDNVSHAKRSKFTSVIRTIDLHLGTSVQSGDIIYWQTTI